MMLHFKRRALIRAALYFSVLTTALPVLAQDSEKDLSNDEDTSGSIVHSVYFWLNDEITKQDEQRFLEYFELLRTVPGARSLSYGKPAKTTKRDVTDNTFDYNLIITFDNLEAISKYENHPKHLAGAERYKKYWKRVQVRDTMIE